MKTKLGISIGLLAAILYILGLVGGYIPVLILTGYILIYESDRWLKISAVKALTVCIFFSAISVVVGLIPNAITFMDNMFRIFNGNFSFPFLSKVVSFANIIITISQKVLLLALALKALNQQTVSFAFVDNLIAKHFSVEKETDTTKQTKKCPKCGAEIDINSTFCGICGEKF